MLKSKKPAFTLAEVMIVLTVIGILSAILLPVALNSTPDKNILKFKKANNTLVTTIRNMISNEQYFTPGDFGRRPDGTLIDDNFDDRHYFGEALADNLTYQNFIKGSPLGYSVPITITTGTSTEIILKTKLDYECLKPTGDTRTPYMILLHDYITIHVPAYVPFGGLSGTNVPYYRDPLDPTADFYSKSSSPNGFDTAVYPICIDVDGSGPIKAFGYGIRRDGKIVNGLRADWWLSRDITKKETDCCPVSLKNAIFTDSGAVTNLCDDSDTVCSE